MSPPAPRSTAIRRRLGLGEFLNCHAKTPDPVTRPHSRQAFPRIATSPTRSKQSALPWQRAMDRALGSAPHREKRRPFSVGRPRSPRIASARSRGSNAYRHTHRLKTSSLTNSSSFFPLLRRTICAQQMKCVSL